MSDAAAGDDAKAEATLEECVRLLSSDSREKKFVGMLLVTRLVPDAADDATLTRVYNATGFARFVTSMLRAAPAPSGDGAAANAGGGEEAEARAAQATASHALALATCAALTKSPDVATDDSMVERLPLFAAAMARKGRYAALPCAAVADACEAATRVIAVGGESIARVAADAGAVAAAAAAVVDAAGADASADDAAPDADADRALPLLGATRLLAMLLESPAAYDHVHGPELDRFEAGDAETRDGRFRLDPGASERSAPFGTAEPEKEKNSASRSASKAARAVARAAPSLAYAFASRPGQPEQIEALRCLSLVLSALPARRPQGRLTAELAKAAAATSKKESRKKSAFSSDWMDDVRGGVASVLGAKAPRELRHVALDLCAACVDLAGPAWLCSDALGAGADPLFAGGRDGDGVKKSGKGNASFFRLALELTRVETAVLLHDLTRDDAELRANARRMLPVPLVLYERLVGALAADVEAAEEEETSARDFSGRETKTENKKSLLSAETAHAAVTSLADVAGSLIEFLEHFLDPAAERDERAEEDPEAGSTDADADADAADVFLAATRALGCFLAELPEPHEARVNRLLPKLFAFPNARGRLSARALGSVPFATETSRALVVRFTLPYVLQATETPAGLDAFADAGGARAVAFLAQRAVSDDAKRKVLEEENAEPAEDLAERTKTHRRARRREALGVVAACVAALRNAADGAARGLAEEKSGEAAGEAFSRLVPDLARWAIRVLSESEADPEEEAEDGDESLAFARRLADRSRGGELSETSVSWRDAAREMALLVPASSALGEGAAVGGGGFLLEREDRGGGTGDGFEDPIEL